jgi:hypothetical protein
LRGRYDLLAMSLTALLLLALAGMAAVSEGRPFFLRTYPVEARVATLLREAASPSPVSSLASSFARTAHLESCLVTLREIATSGSPSAEALDNLSRACQAIAEAIVALSPLSSNAWFIAASFAARSGDFARASRYLDLSYRTGPNEQWIAERRVLFAYPLRDELDPSLKGKIDQDLALLLRTNQGVETLATRYVNDPAMRDHLVDIAVTLDPDTQSRFLSRIRGAFEASH